MLVLVVWSVIAQVNKGMTSPAVDTGQSVTGYARRTVTYYVAGDGTASASLTYENDQGGSQQEGRVRLPWQKTISVSAGHFVYISAQNQERSGRIAVVISVDGREFKQSESGGAYTIATASGSCP